MKLNCVVMRGVNDDELEAFAGMSRERALDVRFIEWMPFDSNGWNGGTFVSYEQMIGASHSMPQYSQRTWDMMMQCRLDAGVEMWGW